ncbi:type 4a pilus biogenesis protein PilO [Geopsychrobacter electrodiphilus]|uniref:type 4a pilus biogenesis protein PilO n=1 Tax=Geopsychrobacter electrodiphilus TaxID=225196 RepID=UPI0003819E71|nr:type 4a pilus biogenesis protein PilO [Geopsychrobacter electrodiphilus]
MLREQFIRAFWEENRRKIFLLSALILLVFAFHFIQIFWFDQKIVEINTQLQTNQSELQIAQQRLEEGGGEKITGIAEDLEHFYQIIPQRSGLGNFIGRIYSYAGDAGIDIAQISYVAKPVETTKLLSYTLNFGVSGSYPQLKKFIYLLENSPSVLILDKISLNSHHQEKNDVVGLQIELKTFFQGGE